MRTQRIQSKIAEVVLIPSHLREFFQEVDTLIKENDERTTIESDDLIQAPFAYGGLMEGTPALFGFTYFPEEDTRPTWEIVFTASEITEIATGQTKALNLWKCQNPECRSFFASASDTCFDCDYVDDEREEKKRILGTLPQDLTREDWVKGYLSNFPEAHPLEIIGDYNSQLQLGKKWGYFSLDEMRSLIEKLRGPSR